MTNDLISRSAIFKKIQPVDFLYGHDEDAPYSGMAVDACDVEAAPAVDAVEVVRCTECQYMKIKAGLCYCKVWQGYNGMGSEGFCSYGERSVNDPYSKRA